MATKFVTNLNLLQNQIINGRFEVVASDPITDNFEGRLIYNSTEKVLKWYDGSVWRKTLKSVTSNTTALTTSESNGTVSLTIADVVNSGASGLMNGSDKAKLDAATSLPNASTVVMRDASARFRTVDPSDPLDVANKAYVDAARSGLDVKQSVRYATNDVLPAYTFLTNVLTAAGNGTLTVDGQNPDVGERILVKNEAGGNAKYNGIYTVTDTGSGSVPFVLTRATDADDNFEVTPGLFVFVESGSTWADSGWILTVDGPIILNTSSLTFVQFSAAGQSIAGGGLTKTGNTFDVVGTADRITVNPDSVDIASTYVGQTSITTVGTIATGTWEATDVAVLHGGTGASTASDARTNLGATSGSYSTTVPVLSRVAAQTVTGASTTFSIDHYFGTKDVVVQVFDVATNDTVIADVVRSSVNQVQVTFSVAPGMNSYRVVVAG